MLHHVSVGVANLERAARFYDAVLGALGFTRVMEVLPYAVAYGDTEPKFWVQLPHDRRAAAAGNGVHFGFVAPTKDAVIAFHRAALDAGGTDEGAPGPRPDYGPDYYGAFVRDPDGHKLEALLVPAARRKVRKRKRKAATKKARRATASARTRAKRKKR